MGVVSTHRRQGIGARLLANALEAAEALDLARIELQVFRSNEPAVHLYRSKGFQVEGEQLGARILDDVTDDIILMCCLYE